MFTEDIDAALTRLVPQLLVLQEVAQDFREVRFARAKKARHPYAHHITGLTTTAQGLADLSKGIADLLDLVFDLIGDDILAELRRQRRMVKDLDHALDLDADIPLDDVTDGHLLLLTAASQCPSRLAPEQLHGEVVPSI